MGCGTQGVWSGLPDDEWFRHALSTMPAFPSARAQWAPQYHCPSASTPCPITWTRQCSQIGAIRWMAQAKQSKTCTAPCACTSKDMP